MARFQKMVLILSFRTSFDNVDTKWAPEVQAYCPQATCVLCGTKCDMKEALATQPQQIVSEEEGREQAKRMKAYKYIECSALTGHNLKRVFDAAIISVLYPVNRKKKRCIIM